MKRLLVISAFLTACLLAGAQTRSYSDNANSTCIVGLETYFFGVEGSLNIQAGGRTVNFRMGEGKIWADDVLLETCEGPTVIGAHDFTGDRSPELVVARRTDNDLSVKVYGYVHDAWTCIGRAGSAAKGVRDIRVFRQALTIRNYETNALYTWTWRGGQFEFKSSDGSGDPTL